MLFNQLDFDLSFWGRDSLKRAREFTKETGWKLVAVVCLANLLLTAFSLRTLLSIFFLGVALVMLLAIQWRKVQAEGLIQFLPQSISTLLLHRSFFDVLCDVWFYPRLSLILKATLTPFFIDVKPENAMQLLDNLEENDRKLFLTKGMVYALPKWLKHMILPKSYKLQKKIHDFMDSDDEEPPIRAKPEELADTGSFLSVQEKVDLLNLARQTETGESVQRRPTRTRLIMSSQMLKGLRFFPGKMTEQWDNLSKYKREADDRRRSQQRSVLEDEDALEANQSFSRARSGVPPTEQLSPFNVVFNLIELKKQKLLKRFSRKFLWGLFVCCVGFFAVNLGVSRRYRQITKNILVSSSYMAIVGLSLASFSALLMKIRSEKALPAPRPF